jgi:hypothetical protein
VELQAQLLEKEMDFGVVKKRNRKTAQKDEK